LLAGSCLAIRAVPALPAPVAGARAGPLDLLPLDDQGPARVERRGAVPVDVGSHDVRGAPHGDAIGEVVDAPPLAGAAETPGDDQVIVATAVKQHGRLDLRGPEIGRAHV